MALGIELNRSRFVAFVAVFTALITVFDVIPILPGFYAGIWDSWIFLLSPIIGILLGPIPGAISVGLGSLLGHFIRFRDFYEFVFMFGAPLGAAMSVLIYQKRWQPVLIIYTGLLVGYFLTPVSWILPLIGIWDILVGYGILWLYILLVVKKWWPSTLHADRLFRLGFGAIIGLESDILLRVFILVPGQTYWLFYGMTPELLQVIWLTAGFITPLKVILGMILTMTLGISLLQILPKLGIYEDKKIEVDEETSVK
jgi:hypothetical protein